jgi:hypothetical protein
MSAAVRLRARASHPVRPPLGGRRLEPTRENMHDRDDFREYRRGRATPSWQPKPWLPRRPDRSDTERRAQYAMQVARFEFGRFYWDDKRDAELKAAMRQRRKRNGSNPEARKRNGAGA